MRRLLLLATVALALAAVAPSAPSASAAPAAQAQAFAFFPETGHNIGLQIKQFYDANGGPAAFGPPLTELIIGSDGLQVQYFERARFEYHPERTGTPDEVTLSPLGRQLLALDPLAQAATAPAAAISLLGQSSTGFNTSATERVTNISRATAMVDSIVVPPGAEFSFAGVGDFSEANGFVDGYAIVGGRLEKVVGGGLCQVSTTLFRAVSNAGLQVTRRVGHSHIVYFYENILGFDATVFTPSVDFRWRNDSAGPVYIVGTVDHASSRMTFQLYGISDGRQVRHEGPFVKNRTQPGAPVWQLDRSLPSGAVRQLVHGRGGADVTYNRIITFANGRTRTDTYFTRYTPWEDFYIYGPGVTPPPGAKVIAPR